VLPEIGAGERRRVQIRGNNVSRARGLTRVIKPTERSSLTRDRRCN
jgi:hypothetical protein